MAYDQAHELPLRRELGERRTMSEKKMFGGICFLLHDHMLCAIGKQGFMFRVGVDQEAEALLRPGARAMEFSNRRMRGFVWVDRVRCRDADLRDWIALAERYV